MIKDKVRLDYVRPRMILSDGRVVMFGDLSVIAREGEGTIGPLRRLFRLELSDSVRVTYESVRIR